ncbi:MAG: hypothetical protein PVG18_03075 [Thioalkalispiraceae bacterium]|jgi:hypothetical protein
MTYLEQLEKMLEMKHRLVTIETDDPERVADLFTELSRFSNKAFYMSQAYQGLHRIGASHITIPRTQTAKDLLEHIEAVQHFGVYILRDFSHALQDPHVIGLIKKILAGDIEKVIILLGEYIDLPKELKPYTLRSKHQMKKAG